PTPARRAHTPLVVLQLSRPAFRLSPVEPPEKPPSKRAVALLRRRQPRPEDPAQIRLPFDAH
ncbi:ethanolamine utilization protein, partial [Pandoraea apista]